MPGCLSEWQAVAGACVRCIDGCNGPGTVGEVAAVCNASLQLAGPTRHTNEGPLSPFTDPVEPGLVRVLASACPGLCAAVCYKDKASKAGSTASNNQGNRTPTQPATLCAAVWHHREKRLVHSLAADGYTVAFACAPARSVVIPAPVTHRVRHASARCGLGVAISRPARSLRQCVVWTDIAAVLNVGVDGVVMTGCRVLQSARHLCWR